MVKEKKFAIYFLQEVHCTNETEPYWHSEWGSDSTFFTTFSSSRGGVAILFNNYFQFQILKHFADPEGSYIITERYWGQNYDTSTLSTRLTRITQPSLETCMASCAPLNALL